MSKWNTLKHLSRRERAWLWQAWLFLPVVSVLLRLIGYRRTMAWLQTLCTGKTASVPAEADAAALGRLVNIAARYSVMPVSCLPRSVALWWLLRRAGVAADLRIGVQKEADVFMAHAWVEISGVPVGDTGSGRYGAFALSFAPLKKGAL